MRQAEALGGTARQEEVVQLLVDAGVKRNLARTVVFLARVPEANSSDLVDGAGLRQPEVSMAMQELRVAGWVAKRDERTGNKGRPMHWYRLARPLAEIVAEIEGRLRTQVARDAATVERLRLLAPR